MKTVILVFVISTINTIYGDLHEKEPNKREINKTNAAAVATTNALTMSKHCSKLPDGNGVVAVYPKICTKLYVSCKNYSGTLNRCEKDTYLNPDTKLCVKAIDVVACRSFFNITSPPLVTNDGATAYCRNQDACDGFKNCCLANCLKREANPVCSSDGEKAFGKAEAFCKCTYVTYVQSKSISERCMQTDNCIEFHMCCLLEGCPMIYTQCFSPGPDKKPTNGTCYC